MPRSPLFFPWRSRACTWIIAAPASWQRAAASPISAGCLGMTAPSRSCCMPPLIATVMMTLLPASTPRLTVPSDAGRLAPATQKAVLFREDEQQAHHRARGRRRQVRKGASVANIRQITDWRAPTKIGESYDKLLAAIGTHEFGATVRDSVLSLTAGARRVYLFEATSRESSTLQYSFCEPRSEEHTSELQSQSHISYAV